MSVQNLFLKSGYVASPLANGIGRFVLQCQRMTIKFCKSHGSSRGVRAFIENDLVNFARNNPGVVVYLKPRRHRSPVLVTEYLNGGREWFSLHDMDHDEVCKWLELYRTSAGYGQMHFKSYHHSDCPSIQGVWDPFKNQSSQKNIMIFPNEAFQNPANLKPSTTEIIQKVFSQSNSN